MPRFALLALTLIVTLTGCTTPRPPSQTCRGFGLTGDSSLPAGGNQTGPIAAEVDRLLALRSGPGSRGPIVVDYLVMSTGGQYGAFGSGFLSGWGENTSQPRPEFDIVTGASAGGVIAPFALAGHGFDDSLTLNAGIGTEDVLRRRSPLEMLGANSIMDISLFEARIRAAIDPPLIAAMALTIVDGVTPSPGKAASPWTRMVTPVWRAASAARSCLARIRPRATGFTNSRWLGLKQRER